VLSPGVRVNSYCEVEHSILFPHVSVGRHCRIRRAIIDRGVQIPERAEIGLDPEQDRANGFVLTEGGIVVVDHAPQPVRVLTGAHT
jgi:glucose-1-phosphate adenylyltransferase